MSAWVSQTLALRLSGQTINGKRGPHALHCLGTTALGGARLLRLCQSWLPRSSGCCLFA